MRLWLRISAIARRIVRGSRRLPLRLALALGQPDRRRDHPPARSPG
jgi:hypothetical protein